MRVRVFKASKGWRVVRLDEPVTLIGTLQNVVLSAPTFDEKSPSVSGVLESVFSLCSRWKPLTFDGRHFRSGRKRVTTAQRVAFIGTTAYVEV